MLAALIALMVLLMLGGTADSGWTVDLEKAVKHSVQEKEQRELVLDALDEHKGDMEEVRESLQSHFTELLNTHLDFRSSEHSFDAVAEKLKQDQANAFAKDLKTRGEMKRNLTPEEWNAVFAEDQEK